MSNDSMKKLPIDVSNLQTMVAGDYIYVDKTQQISKSMILYD